MDITINTTDIMPHSHIKSILLNVFYWFGDFSTSTTNHGNDNKNKCKMRSNSKILPKWDVAFTHKTNWF